MDQKQVFPHVRAFLCMKVRVYAFATCECPTRVYTQLRQSEPAYMYFSSF